MLGLQVGKQTHKAFILVLGGPHACTASPLLTGPSSQQALRRTHPETYRWRKDAELLEREQQVLHMTQEMRLPTLYFCYDQDRARVHHTFFPFYKERKYFWYLYNKLFKKKLMLLNYWNLWRHLELCSKEMGGGCNVDTGQVGYPCCSVLRQCVPIMPEASNTWSGILRWSHFLLRG